MSETPLPPPPVEKETHVEPDTLAPSAAAPLPTFPEYGQGGDYVGQRRARRAFRYAVLAVIAFSLALRYYEGFKRLDLYETQYRMALTLLEPSARPVLRNIVRMETNEKGQPTPLYAEALAGLEEDEKILPAFEAAARLSPNNQGLLIKYGCELFLQQDFEKAREKFREAGVHPPRNALPNYLEAAALAKALKPGSDLSEAMAIVARANNSGAPLIFPAPLWHSTLPKTGEYYARHRRDLARKVCAPLSQFKQMLVERAAHEIDTGAYNDWDAWLEKLEEMGRRIAMARSESDEAESTQVMAGINIEQEAAALRANLAAKTGADTSPLEARAAKLSAAMGLFTDFESERLRGIEKSSQEVWRPMLMLRNAITAALLLYLLVWTYGFLMRAEPRGVALAHSRLGVAVLGLGILAFGGLIHLLILVGNDGALAAQVEYAAYGLVGFLLVFGAFYPSLALPRVAWVLAQMPAPTPDARKAAVRARRNAGVALARRYFGVLLGGFFIVIAVWILSFRMAVGVYPDQVQLLVSGMNDLEQQTIRRAIVELP